MTNMKKIDFSLIILLSIYYMASCSPSVQHADPFYNYNGLSHARIPLIKPIYAYQMRSSEVWFLELQPVIWLVESRDSQGVHYYVYDRVEGLEKFAVKNGVIMAYSWYVDKDANAHTQDNYYHWFVMVPDQQITQGFQTEEEFRSYIKTLGVQDPDWQTPDEAFQQFRHTGCLDWIPDCK